MSNVNQHSRLRIAPQRPLRSLLFVPADSERKLHKAQQVGADALVLDLEDSVAPARKPDARALLLEYLSSYSGSSRPWVRVNNPASGELLRDLAALARCRVEGIVVPKLRGPHDLDTVSHYLDMAEVCGGLQPGCMHILAVCTETPLSVLRLGELAQGAWPRLAGLLWGGEDLSSAVGATGPRGADGSWRPVYEFARTQCLLACHALEIAAIDTVYVDVRDAEGCRRASLAARHDGFTGKVAVHPDQVPLINEAFTPTAAEIEYAQRVVAAFEGDTGVVTLDGRMLDLPHLRLARRVLGAV
jgi:citrate lyase subunit beta / citryl-CoA lyase